LAEANGNVEKDEADRVNLSSIELDSNIDRFFVMPFIGRGGATKHKRTTGCPIRTTKSFSTTCSTFARGSKSPNRDHGRPFQNNKR
jgi:hypothetical protein